MAPTSAPQSIVRGVGVDARRHLHHVVDDALQALDVVGHHARQLLLVRRQPPLRAAARWPARSPPAGCGSRARCRPRPGPSPPASPAAGAPARCAGPRAAARSRPRSASVVAALAVAARPREAHAQAQRARRAVVEAQHHVAPPSGQRPCVEGLLDRRPGQPAHAGSSCSSNGAARAMPLRRQQRARRRVGRAHAQAAVDHQHAVGHLLDHQPVQLRLLARQLEAAARGRSSRASRPASSPASSGDDEEADAGQPGWRQPQRQSPAVRPVARPPNSSISDTAAVVASASSRGSQHAGHQHRQHQQRRVVEAPCGRQQMQRRERQTGRRRSCQATAASCQAGPPLGGRPRKRGSSPQRQRLRGIQQTRRSMPRRQGAEQAAEICASSSATPSDRARADKDAVQALERADTARSDDASRLTRQEAAVGRRCAVAPARHEARIVRRWSAPPRSSDVGATPIASNSDRRRCGAAPGASLRRRSAPVARSGTGSPSPPPRRSTVGRSEAGCSSLHHATPTGRGSVIARPAAVAMRSLQ